MANPVSDYTTVTEVPDSKVSREQLEKLYNRYCFASKLCEGKDVLEVACGSGIGLGYLAKKAKMVVGGDYTENLLNIAQRHHRDKISLIRLDAHKLPFAKDSFDAVVFHEAIYYLSNPENFISECRRILRKDGLLIISTVNKDWTDHIKSPFSLKYFSVPELNSLLNQNGFDVEFFGHSPVNKATITSKIISIIRRTAKVFNIVPKTMKGKEFFKRVFFGKLLPLEAEITDGVVEYIPPTPIPYDRPNVNYKIFYVVARMRSV